jgi:hypothetical protein
MLYKILFAAPTPGTLQVSVPEKKQQGEEK